MERRLGAGQHFQDGEAFIIDRADFPRRAIEKRQDGRQGAGNGN